MAESDLKKKMAALIRAKGGWARSIPGGPFAAGLPDLIFFYRGYGGGLEVKLPGKQGNVTPLQRATLDGIKQAGGIAMVVWDVGQVEAMINAIDRKKDKRK